MKIRRQQLKKMINKVLVEMPVSKSAGYFSQDIDTRRPELLELSKEIDSMFQEWDIVADIQLFDSGYQGISIKFTGNDGSSNKWLVVDQPGKVGLEDQTTGYIFFGPGGPIRSSNAWVWEQPEYLDRGYGDVSIKKDVRQQTYSAILDTIDDMLRTPIGMGGSIKESKMRITKRQLRKIIREAIEAVDSETGEVMTFHDGNDAYGDGWEADAPEAAWPDLVKRLGLSPESQGTEPDGAEVYALSGEDMMKLWDEVRGKQGRREQKKRNAERKAERERLNIDNLMDRARKWAEDAGSDWKSDHSSGNLQGYPDLEGAAYDLARNARYEFAEDEWDELLWHFDDDEHMLYDFIMNSMM